MPYLGEQKTMANVYVVSNVSELYAALANATGGETIRMKGGDYGHLDLKAAYHNLTYDSPVTITSDNPDDPAIVSEMRLNGASNITFENITFKSYYTASPLWYEPFVVRNSENITFNSALFEGTPAKDVSETEDGTGRAKGLYVESSNNIAVTNSQFAMWYRGMVFSDVENLTVAHNEVHSIRSDGMNFSGVRDVLIESNYIHDFKTVSSSGDHADMIQIINLGNSTSEDITIRGNIFDIGQGNTVQTLFMRNQYVDQTGAGLQNFYQNVIIEENIILNGHAHGITVGETNNLVVRNNTVLSIEKDNPEFSSAPYITVAEDSNNVVINSNVSSAISGYTGQSDWQIGENILVQNHDPQKEGFYENEFVTSTLKNDGVKSIAVRSDSIIAEKAAGATQLLPGQSGNSVEPLFNLYSVEHTPHTIFFDAGESFVKAGGSLPIGTKFHWDFGDGSTAEGSTATHTYTAPGVYTANLNIVLPENGSYTETVEVELGGNTVLSMNTSTGSFQQHNLGETSQIIGSQTFTETTNEGKNSLTIGASTGVSSVPKEFLDRFFGADNFEMSMTLQAKQPGVSHGEIARIHDSFILTVDSNGNLDMLLVLDTGAVRLASTGVQINDGQSHDISIALVGKNNLLKIDVNGKEVGSLEVEGNTPGMAYWGLTFGNAWGKQTFEGYVSDFRLNVEAYDYPVLASGEVPTETPIYGTPKPEIITAIFESAAIVEDIIISEADEANTESGDLGVPQYNQNTALEEDALKSSFPETYDDNVMVFPESDLLFA